MPWFRVRLRHKSVKSLSCKESRCEEVRIYAGYCRTRSFAQLVVIVYAHYGDIIWHVQSGEMACTDDSLGYLVVCGQDAQWTRNR